MFEDALAEVLAKLFRDDATEKKLAATL